MSAMMGDQQLALALRLEGRAGAASEEVERLVGVADMVAALPDPDIDPVFAAKLEQRLLTEGLAEQVSEPVETYQGLRIVREEPKLAPAHEEKVAPNVVVLPRRRYMVRKTLVAAIAAALAAAMPLAMASTALPGTLGYGIKEWKRSVQLDFATGAAKVFKYEAFARDYLAEAAQLVEIDGGPSLIERTLAKANLYQRIATRLAIESRSQALIAKLRGMIERDGDALRTLLPAAEGSRPAVFGAIDTVEGLSDALARAMGIVIGAPATAGAPTIESLAAEVATTSEGPEGSTASAPKGTDPGAPGAPAPPKVGPGDEGKKKGATRGDCRTIGEGGIHEGPVNVDGQTIASATQDGSQFLCGQNAQAR